jgi:AcrR family transcriptional regulator
MPANGRSFGRSATSALRAADAAAARTAGRATEHVEPLAPRGVRRKQRTRERLLDAAQQVFLARGYDGATTGEMARVADLGAGTFYLHFRDKRAAFEGLAQRAARTMMDRWLATIEPRMGVREGIALALTIAAAFWREDLDRARLLLEGGPSFGNAAHLRLVDELSTVLRSRFASRDPAARRPAAIRGLAAFVVGLGVEIGRVVAGNGGARSTATVSRMIALARRVI